ncbi:MAG: hypothetical protein JSS96_08585 [Bacteroidetes bacterium]|nr:hypothetical protein [Bacteroidota bacterium]
MSLLSNAKKNNKKDNKSAKGNAAAANTTVNKASKSAGVSKKPVKTGGTRGS